MPTSMPCLSAADQVNTKTAQVWSLAADDIMDDDIVRVELALCTYGIKYHIFQELLDSNTLLAEEDLLKPDPSSLRSVFIA